MGGCISHITKRYSKADDQYMIDYDGKDANNLFGLGMRINICPMAHLKWEKKMASLMYTQFLKRVLMVMF